MTSQLPPSTSDTNPTGELLPVQRTRQPWVKRLLPAVAQPRKRVFFDSPGLLEQSSHWAGLVVWTIGAGTTAALLWAFLGKVDQTVTALGSLEPASGKVSVKSPSGGIIRELWVKDGDEVQQGERLLAVENQGTIARLQSVRKQQALLEYENRLYNLLLDRSGYFASADLPAPPAFIAGDDKTRSIQLTVQQTAAQLRQLRSRLQSQQRTLTLKSQLVKSLEPLFQQGGFAKYNYLNSVDELQRFESDVTQTREQINGVLAEAGRQVSTNDRQILSLNAEAISLTEQQRNLTLKAVQPGTVFNLSVRPGTVIAGGTEVMRIIPDGQLKAMVFLPNTELGFVKQGMPVKLAVSSFPPGEYGYLNAKVVRIGADALSGEDGTAASQQKANTFPLMVQLEKNKGKDDILARLAPGMQVSANIIVRQRPVITLLTDVFTKGTESLQGSR